MSIDSICKETKAKMEKVIAHLQDDLKGIRTGRASTGLVENIRVEYYGNPSPLKQLAVISTPDAQSILIKPYDTTIVSNIEKAIIQSDIGLTPSVEAKTLRIVVPPLNEERRKKLSVTVKDFGESTKVSLRNVRQDSNKQADKEKKENILTEDDVKRARDEIQKIIRDFETKVNDLIKKKTEEILKV